jgi:hygromycin-B 4-O-kinase
VERPAVDHAAAAAYLSTRFGDDVSDVVAAPRQGAWSRAYFFRHDGADLVIRFAENAWNFEQDRRYAVHSSPDLPIPHVLEIGVVEIGEAAGSAYAISERVFGDILEELDVDRMRRTLPSLFGALDAVRRIDLSATTGFGPPVADGNGECATWREHLLTVGDDQPTLAANPVRGWRAQLDTRPHAARTFDRTLDELASLADACPEIRHLLHSDLLYGNVLVEGDRVSGVFDWGCALYGDFLYDLAWLTFWAPWHPGLAALDLRAEALAHYADIRLVVDDFDARLRCYEVHIGLAHLAYHSFTQEWDHLDWTERRTLEVLTAVR